MRADCLNHTRFCTQDIHSAGGEANENCPPIVDKLDALIVVFIFGVEFLRAFRESIQEGASVKTSVVQKLRALRRQYFWKYRMF